MFLGTPWSPQLCLTAFFTMRPSSRSREQAIDFASMPISCRKTSGRKVTSNRRRSRQLSNVAAGRPKTELSINTTADHLARQTGEFYFAIIGEIPRAIDMACTHTAVMAVLARLGGGHGSELRVAALGSAAARVLRAYATQVEVLRRLRHGGQQYVRVEHVYVNDGGQAVIGNVKQPEMRG